MKKYCLCFLAGIAVILGIVGVIFYYKNPLSFCTISPYEVENYQTYGQYYVVASYPIEVRDNINYFIKDYVVEKKDDQGKYRTVYDSIKRINPIEEELVVRNPYNQATFFDMTLQPLVDIYGNGEYRVLQFGKDETETEPFMIAKEYYVVSGEHLIKHDNFAEVFQITEEDLQNIEIYNLNHKFDLTEEEKSTFINLILNMRTVSIRTENYNTLVLALRIDSLNMLGDYTILLNLPNGKPTCIYSKTGKDLDGNAYQAIFSSKETLVCLDCDEKLLPMLDALKQKYKAEHN